MKFWFHYCLQNKKHKVHITKLQKYSLEVDQYLCVKRVTITRVR